METAIVKAACAIGAGIAMGFGAIGLQLAKVMPLAKRWKAWPASRKWQTCCVPT